MTTHSQRKQLVSLLAAAVMPMIVGLANPNAVRGDDALTTSKIEFRIADDEPFDGSRKMVTLGSEQEIHVGQEVILNHEEVTHAAVISTEQGRPAISTQFSERGTQKLRETTGKNKGKRIAILLNDEVIQAPKIAEPIGNRAVIAGDFSIQKVVAITHALNHTERFESKTNPTISLDSFTSLFNGKDLTGWTNVNTAEDTWRVENGLLVCKGLPIGVMRSNKQYENFILHIEWRHMKPGGNSGVFVWSEGETPAGKPLPKGMEVQMLELDWVNQHPRNGRPNHVGYVSGELFGAGGLSATADNPRGKRSMSRELRCNGAGQWNTYDVVCVDGTVKLSINGVFVNSIRDSEVRRGYLCLESEGSEIHFRNIKILELPIGLTSSEQHAKQIDR